MNLFKKVNLISKFRFQVHILGMSRNLYNFYTFNYRKKYLLLSLLKYILPLNTSKLKL